MQLTYASEITDEKKIKLLRTAYPEGTVIKIYSIEGRITPYGGAKAEVQYIDDEGNLHTKLENGKEVIITNSDNFSVFPR